MKFQTAYSQKVSPVIDFTDKPSLTEQNHKDSCEINRIMAKYQKTGIIDHRNEHRGDYGYATSQTFSEALDIVIKGKEMFEELPSSLRKKFNGDPKEFLEFVQNPKNVDEMVELGLARTPEDIPSQIEQLVEYTIEKVTPKRAPGALQGDSDTPA